MILPHMLGLDVFFFFNIKKKIRGEDADFFFLSFF